MLHLRAMDEIRVREAADEDREALCCLYRAFHQYHAAGVPDRLVDLGPATGSCTDTELYSTLGELMERVDAALFVAETGGAVVAFAEAYARSDEANAYRHAVSYGLLQSLFVQEAHRRRGIGRALLAAAERWSIAQGAAELRVDTWEFAGDPVGFYERWGYHTLRRTMVRELRPEGRSLDEARRNP